MGRVIILPLLHVWGYLFAFQPRRLQLFWGALLGSLLYRGKFRISVVQQNLARAFPESIEKQKVVLRASYTHFGNLVLEILMLFGPFKKFILKNVTVEGLENIREAERHGQGTIYLSSHVGNWEVMAAAGALIAKNDLMLVTKHLKPEWFHQGIQRARLSYAVRATYEPRTLRDILSHLKKNGTVGFVLDQYAGPPVGVRVPLFGIPVGTSEIVAAMAKRTGARVLPVVIFREPSGRYRIQVRAAVAWEKSMENSPLLSSARAGGHYDLAANTARYTAIIEQDIRNHPEQWLWIHRRFKGDLTPLREREWEEARTRH